MEAMDYERLAARHKDAVYRQMVRVCGNHEDAEDVLVEALISAFRAKEKLRDEESFRGWLAVIGRRVCGRMKKREALRPIVSLIEGLDTASPSDLEIELGRKEIKACVRNAIDGLPKAYKDVYELRDVEELSAEETARRLNISVAAVKSRLHRARKIVRDRLDRELSLAA